MFSPQHTSDTTFPAPPGAWFELQEEITLSLSASPFLLVSSPLSPSPSPFCLHSFSQQWLFSSSLQGSTETWLHCVCRCARGCAQSLTMWKNTVLYIALSCTFPSYTHTQTRGQCFGGPLPASSVSKRTVKDTEVEKHLTDACWDTHLAFKQVMRLFGIRDQTVLILHWGISLVMAAQAWEAEGKKVINGKWNVIKTRQNQKWHKTIK